MLTVTAAGLAALASVSLLFFHSLLGVLPMLPALYLLLRFASIRLCERRQEILRRQFGDGINAFAAALRAGYSPENGLLLARDELARIYGESSLLGMEFSYIGGQLSVSSTLESAFSDLAARSGISEIAETAEVFAIAKRSGGSLAEILQDSAAMLRDRARTRQEIRDMCAAQRLEYRIMCVMPAAVLLYLNLSGPDFVAGLYGSVRGALTMAVILAVYAAAVLWGEKLLKVDI